MLKQLEKQKLSGEVMNVQEESVSDYLQRQKSWFAVLQTHAPEARPPPTVQ
ncbi:hypothetical protein [Escherichia coli]|uniref:hypothetical protein n=1 Tax=Escherichia coli TaxID=562 RepID=UPI0035A5B377